MAQRADRMSQQHPRSGVTHHASNPLAVIRVVAVNRTPPARRLPVTVHTRFDLPTRVAQQLAARLAQRRAVMMRNTVQLDHLRDHPRFVSSSSDSSRHSVPG